MDSYQRFKWNDPQGTHCTSAHRLVNNLICFDCHYKGHTFVEFVLMLRKMRKVPANYDALSSTEWLSVPPASYNQAAQISDPDDHQILREALLHTDMVSLPSTPGRATVSNLKLDSSQNSGNWHQRVFELRCYHTPLPPTPKSSSIRLMPLWRSWKNSRGSAAQLKVVWRFADHSANSLTKVDPIKSLRLPTENIRYKPSSASPLFHCIESSLS